MLLDYFSTWIIFLFILWLIICKKAPKIANYINPYYLSILLIVGHLINIYTQVILIKEEYELTFFILSAIIHFAPLLILCYMKKTQSKFAMVTTLLLFSLYILYIKLNNKNICEIYLINDQPKKIEDIEI